MNSNKYLEEIKGVIKSLNELPSISAFKEENNSVFKEMLESIEKSFVYLIENGDNGNSDIKEVIESLEELAKNDKEFVEFKENLLIIKNVIENRKTLEIAVADLKNIRNISEFKANHAEGLDELLMDIIKSYHYIKENTKDNDKNFIDSEYLIKSLIETHPELSHLSNVLKVSVGVENLKADVSKDIIVKMEVERIETEIFSLIDVINKEQVLTQVNMEMYRDAIEKLRKDLEDNKVNFDFQRYNELVSMLNNADYLLVSKLVELEQSKGL